MSSIVNEGIRTILNLFFFLREDLTRTKKHKQHTSEQKQKRQHFYAHKKNLRRRKSLVCSFVLFHAFCAFSRFL